MEMSEIYDFDRVIDRKQTNDMKWHSAAVSKFMPYEFPEDMIPMWLADTEFGCAPVIIEALHNRVEKEIFGYCSPGRSFYESVCFWQKKQFNWEIQSDWISVVPTVVAGINVAIRAFTEEGDGVIIQQPVYDPFASLIRKTGRRIVNNGLLQNNGRYEMNFSELEKLAAVPENKLMILCSPHNPVGRVWTEGELRRVAEICFANNMLLVTDEIHSDIVYDGYVHHPLPALDDQYEERTILFTAPGKTFNVAGLKTSIAVIPDERIRKRFNTVKDAMSLDISNTFGIEAVTAAYSPEGHAWMEEELSYLQNNVDFLERYITKYMPGVSMIRPEGTFLCWLDLTDLGFSDEALLHMIALEAAVICVPGTWFGPGGEGHLRLNIGCPQSMLAAALDRMRAVLYKS